MLYDAAREEKRKMHHHVASHFAHELGQSIIHGFGWGIGYQLAKHLPFIVLVVVALVFVGWYLSRRAR
jgi:ABC-type xylose transport system permease subunit